MDKATATQRAANSGIARLQRLARSLAAPFRKRFALPATRKAELGSHRSTPYGVGLGLVIYLVIGAIFLGRAIFEPTGTFAGHPGDAEQYMWYLGLFWHAVLNGQNPFITHLMNYPYGMNLMWNTSIIAESIVFGPLVPLIGSTAAYNVWFLINVLSAGLIAQQLYLRLGTRQSLAISGGALTAMLPYITTQSLSHISLVTTAPLLSGLLILTMVAKGQARRPILLGTLLGLSAAVQFYTLIEVLVSAGLVLVIGIVTIYFSARPALRRVLSRVSAGFVIAALAVFLVLASPGIYEMLLGPYRVFRSVQPPNTYVTDLLNFILPTHAFAVQIPYADPANWFTGNFAEDNGYLGIPAILLLVWAIKRLWRRPIARVLVWSAGVVTLLSLGSTLHVLGFVTPLPLPWLLFDHVPFIKDLLPARLMLYADLAVVALLLLAVEDWLKTRTGSMRRPVTWLGIVVLTWLPVIPYTNTALPMATPSFAPGTSVTLSLRGKPTYVLTAAFPEVMQSLQTSGYAFPVANVYGHNANDAQRQQAINGVGGLLNPSLSPSVYQGIISTALSPLGVRRLVFIPRPRYGLRTLSPDALRALNEAFGPPVAGSNTGVLVWRIPASGTP